jgi:hypothetical protein
MNLSDQDISYFVNIFREDMSFPNKKASYNFLSNVKKYNDDDHWTLTKELFKLCVKKEKQLKAQSIMNIVTEDETMSSKLIRYDDIIKTMFDKYKNSNGREYHSLYEEITEYLISIPKPSDEEQQDLIDGLEWELTEIHKKILISIGVPIDSWKDMGEDKREKDIIFSPQSFKIYMDDLVTTFEKESGVNKERLRCYMKDLQNNLELRIFQKVKK